MTLFQKNNQKVNPKLVSLDLPTVHSIRKNVLYKNFSSTLVKYFEDDLKETLHYGLSINDEIISILTLIKQSFEYARKANSIQLRGMATLNSYQRKGYGSILLGKVIDKLKKEDIYELLWCKSRFSVIKFYKNNNFTPIGDNFKIEAIGLHQTLYYRLKHVKGI